MSKSEFLWTFPSFVLATQYNKTPETGNVLFDEGFRVVSLKLTGDGKRQVPIFTDEASAESYTKQSTSTGIILVELATPEALKDFLHLAARAFDHAVIDLNPRTKFSRLFLIDEILAQVDEWVDQSGNFDH